MKNLDAAHSFWIAVLVIGGYLVFGAVAIFLPTQEGSTIFVNTVLATMGPLVGWVVKALYDSGDPTGKKGDPISVEEEHPNA